MGSAATSKLITKLYEQNPDIQLSFIRCEDSHGLELLRKGKVDVVFTFRYRWKEAVSCNAIKYSDEFDYLPEPVPHS